MFRCLGCVAQRWIKRAGKGVRDVVQVCKKDHIEQPSLTGTGNMFVELGATPIVAGRNCLRMTPHTQTVKAGTMCQKLRKMHL